MELLELTAACASPWGQPLLTNIEFRLRAGTIVAVVGPNGAGKSSLLHLLAGGIELTSGELKFKHKSLRQWPVLARARCLALLPQQSLLGFPYRVDEVILLGRTPHASGTAVDRLILAQVLHATDCTDLQHRLYTRLSGGERQRVQLARVMAQVWDSGDASGRLLLLDEPTAGLDLGHQQLLMRTLRQLADSGCGIIMVIHDFNLAASHADRVIVLDQGRQIVEAPPKAAFTQDLFREVFGVKIHIGSHPMTGAPLVIQE